MTQRPFPGPEFSTRQPPRDSGLLQFGLILLLLGGIGFIAWIITSALAQPSPSGSGTLFAPLPTLTDTIIPGSVTPLLVLMATSPPTLTTVPTATLTQIPLCVPGEATPGQACQGKPKPYVVTPVAMSTCPAEVPEYAICLYEGGT